MHGRVSPVVPSLILRLEAAVFAAMPEAQDEDRRGRDFVAHPIVADDDPANLTWLIGFQLFADPRIIEQPVRRVRSEEKTSELQSLMRISYAGLALHQKSQQM